MHVMNVWNANAWVFPPLSRRQRPTEIHCCLVFSLSLWSTWFLHRRLLLFYLIKKKKKKRQLLQSKFTCVYESFEISVSCLVLMHRLPLSTFPWILFKPRSGLSSTFTSTDINFVSTKNGTQTQRQPHSDHCGQSDRFLTHRPVTGKTHCLQMTHAV